jgi:hypothetical protein
MPHPFYYFATFPHFFPLQAKYILSFCFVKRKQTFLAIKMNHLHLGVINWATPKGRVQSPRIQQRTEKNGWTFLVKVKN